MEKRLTSLSGNAQSIYKKIRCKKFRMIVVLNWRGLMVNWLKVRLQDSFDLEQITVKISSRNKLKKLLFYRRELQGKDRRLRLKMLDSLNKELLNKIYQIEAKMWATMCNLDLSCRIKKNLKLNIVV